MQAFYVIKMPSSEQETDCRQINVSVVEYDLPPGDGVVRHCGLTTVRQEQIPTLPTVKSIANTGASAASSRSIVAPAMCT